MSKNEDVVDISFEAVENNTNNEQEKQIKAPKKKAKRKQSEKKLLNKLADQEKILETIIAERNDYKDKYLRNLAEVDNFRKRMKKEKDDFKRYILGDFLASLLEVVDNIERALKVKSETADEISIITGVEMIYKQVIDLLKKNNVVEIDAMGKPFDPNLHQALSKDESPDVKEPVIIEIYQRGFMYNDKLLRPVLAKVSIPLEVEDTVIERG